MEIQIKVPGTLTLVALPALIALGLTGPTLAQAQSDATAENRVGSDNSKVDILNEKLQDYVPGTDPHAQYGSAGNRYFDSSPSIAANGNFVYILSGRRLYQLRSAGLALVSRIDVGMGGNRRIASSGQYHRNASTTPSSAPNTTGATNAETGASRASDNSTDNNGNHGNNGNKTNADNNDNNSNKANADNNGSNSGTTVGKSSTNGNATVGAQSPSNQSRPLNRGSYGNAGMSMAMMGMGGNFKLAATGQYIYVLSGNVLYQMRASNMALVSQCNLATIDPVAFASPGTRNPSSLRIGSSRAGTTGTGAKGISPESLNVPPGPLDGTGPEANP